MWLIYTLILLGCLRVAQDLPRLGKGKAVQFNKDAGSFVIFAVQGAVRELSNFLVAYFFVHSFLYTLGVLLACASVGYSIYLTNLRIKESGGDQGDSSDDSRVGRFWYVPTQVDLTRWSSRVEKEVMEGVDRMKSK